MNQPPILLRGGGAALFEVGAPMSMGGDWGARFRNGPGRCHLLLSHAGAQGGTRTSLATGSIRSRIDMPRDTSLTCRTAISMSSSAGISFSSFDLTA
jgi:hypothetical protein